VNVHFTCADAASGIAPLACPSDQLLTTEGTAVSSTARTVADRAGNLSDPSNVVTAKIDKTRPTISFSGNLGTYDIDQTILITCAASDALSGIAATSCPSVASGPATQFVGGTTPTTTTMTATASDNAGNATSASTTFTVTVTAAGICRLTATLRTANAICAHVMSIANAPNANAKAGKLGAFDAFLAAQTGKSIPADLADLLSRLAHLL